MASIIDLSSVLLETKGKDRASDGSSGWGREGAVTVRMNRIRKN